jgi:pimeloyl-ACP methyl ester carboxylesterase
MTNLAPLPADALPAGIRSRFVEGVNGLRVHVLEAGHDAPERPMIVLLHGFPELAYSWRRVMLPLAAAGFHVIAPDLRGYGRTTGIDTAYDADLAPFAILNLVRDVVALVLAFGRRSVAMVVGHDAGSSVAASCALVRPDMFQSVALMSAPFAGPPALPFGIAHHPVAAPPGLDIEAALARLEPPRKHYHWYYATRPADADMRRAPQGLHAFLRAYYHHKSADWAGNQPFPLTAWSADELAKLPTYYVMRLAETMAQTVAHEMPTAEQIAACQWLPDAELAVYSGEYARTGFQGGLQWYRCRVTGLLAQDWATFSGRTIDVPACFIAGRADWGVFQKAGDFETMQSRACTRMHHVHLVEGAGHWVQQEQPEAVWTHLLAFVLR